MNEFFLYITSVLLIFVLIFWKQKRQPKQEQLDTMSELQKPNQNKEVQLFMAYTDDVQQSLLLKDNFPQMLKVAPPLITFLGLLKLLAFGPGAVATLRAPNGRDFEHLLSVVVI